MKPNRLISRRYLEMAGRALKSPETKAFALTSPAPAQAIFAPLQLLTMT